MPLLVGQHLTPRQEEFAHLFVALGNKTRAAIKAGFSARTAASAACQLTDPNKNPLVCELIERLRAEKRAANAPTEERISQELARIAYLDIDECYQEDGKPKPLSQMPEDARRALVAVKTFTRVTKDDDGEEISSTHVIDVIAASKLQALKQLADLKGLGRGSGSNITNLNVAAASASVDWASFQEEAQRQPDPVMAQVEEAKALALAVEQGAGIEPSANGHHEDNGYAEH